MGIRMWPYRIIFNIVIIFYIYDADFPFDDFIPI